jgi:hypothetical protein
VVAEWVSGGQLLWQMLVGLVNGYSAQRRNFFEDHVEPLQNKMLEIHKDYITGFEELRRRLKDRTPPTDDLLEFLRERRRDYEFQRQLSRDLALELEKRRSRVVNKELWMAVEDYCGAVSGYFFESAQVGGLSWYSYFIHQVEFRTSIGYGDHYDVWQSPMGISNPADHDLLETVDSVLDKGLPRAFERISKAYAVLRARLL